MALAFVRGSCRCVRGDRLLEREEPRAGELAGKYLPEAGIDIRLGVTARRGRRAGGQSFLDLDDGAHLVENGKVAPAALFGSPYNEFAPSGPDILFGDDGVVKLFGILRSIENRARVS